MISAAPAALGALVRDMRFLLHELDEQVALLDEDDKGKGCSRRHAHGLGTRNVLHAIVVQGRFMRSADFLCRAVGRTSRRWRMRLLFPVVADFLPGMGRDERGGGERSGNSGEKHYNGIVRHSMADLPFIGC